MTDTGGSRPGAAPGDTFAAALRGFGPIGLLSFLVILAGNAVVAGMTGVLVLVWARASGTPWRDLGLARPRSWVLTVIAGITSGVALKFAMKSVVMPLLGADPINRAYHFLVGNNAALPWALYAMIFGAGFGEEMFFRGYLFERFGRRYGTGPWARAFTVAITTAFFGVAHYRNQGLAGVQQATIVGLVYATLYTLTGRLWLPMVAHAAFDLTALWMIYWDLEAEVAHFFFKAAG
jgi:membrane protease YdiL (CAAX protease family)